MPSFGSYLLGAAQLAVLAAGFGYAAWLLRARLVPGWRGAPARLVETVVAVGLLTVVSEVLGTFGLLYAGALMLAAVLVALAARLVPARYGGGQTARGVDPGVWASLVAIAVIAIVVFDWAVTAKHALDAGIFNFDSLWYHMPFSADIVQSHSTTGMHHVETVFLLQQLRAILRRLGQHLAIVVAEDRQTAHHFADRQKLPVGHVAVGRRHDHHDIDQGGLVADG